MKEQFLGYVRSLKFIIISPLPILRPLSPPPPSQIATILSSALYSLHNSYLTFKNEYEYDARIGGS